MTPAERELLPPPFRSRTRAELVALCEDILHNDPWDDNAVYNSAVRLADLLFELTGNTGAEPLIE